MFVSDQQILDGAFVLHGTTASARFFERMDSAYTGSRLTASSRIDIHVHAADSAELADAVTDWSRWGHFHHSRNYAHWNLEGPTEAGGIFLPREGVLFQFSAATSRLDVYIDTQQARRADELLFHAARNIALWRRSARCRPMLHASAVVTDSGAWLFLGGKGAGKSTLFIDGVLRRSAKALANDRVLLDASDGRTIWSWPSYLSYCQGTILDYPELREVFDAASTSYGLAGPRLYRRSYEQTHKKIVPPYFLSEVLGIRYERSAPIAGVLSARLDATHRGGFSVEAVGRTSELGATDIAGAVLDDLDPDFPAWHGACGQAAASSGTDAALDWLRESDVPFYQVALNPVSDKARLFEFLERQR